MEKPRSLREKDDLSQGWAGTAPLYAKGFFFLGCGLDDSSNSGGGEIEMCEFMKRAEN